MRRRILACAASVMLISCLAVTQASASTTTISASGSSARFHATVRNAKTCSWSSNPTIPAFAASVGCKNGVISRVARFSANTSGATKSYVITLTVRGKSRSSFHWDATQAAEPSPLGTTQVVHDSGKNALAVNINQIIDPAIGNNQYEQPNAGYRFVAIEMNLTNQSSATISDDANGDTDVIGTDNQAYTPDFSSITECTNFSYGSFTIFAGGTENGCVVFQIPNGVNVKLVQFSLGFGFLDSSQWNA